MRKKIVASMLVIALAAALLGGAISAWFSAGASTNASFTAGTLDLADLQPSLVTISDMAPGDQTVPEDITIKNTGSLELFYRISFVNSSPGTLWEVLHLLIDGDDKGTLENLGTGYIFDSTMKLSGGASEVISVSFKLPGTAGNEYKGESFSGSLVVQAVQVKNNIDDDGNPINWN